MENINLGISPKERKMFLEVSRVLGKHGNLKRKFGLFEVHTHFPLKEKETLYETNNPQKRTHTVVVKNKEELGSDAKPTQWILDKNHVLIFQYCCK